MTSIKLGWGWNVTLLYALFAGGIITLVVASSRQQIDLVSKDYYKDEIAYQEVLDAGRNQAKLAGAVSVHANENAVFIDFPQEFNTFIKTGKVQFYAVMNKDWDYTMPLNTGEGMLVVPREKLHDTRYTIKMTYAVNGRNYYYESQIDLHQ